MSRSCYVYIITNQKNRVLYIGVTNDLIRHIYEHKHKLADGFSKKYNLNKLVYFEPTDNIESAILFEKKLKGCNRQKKIDLLTGRNPEWLDLAEAIYP